MWPASYWPANVVTPGGSYWAASYWPKTGASGAGPTPGGSNQYLPMLGIGSSLLLAVSTLLLTMGTLA